MTNAFAMLRLLPMNDRDKDLEILALRHQVTVLHIHADAVDRRGCRRNPLGTVLRLLIAWGP